MGVTHCIDCEGRDEALNRLDQHMIHSASYKANKVSFRVSTMFGSGIWSIPNTRRYVDFFQQRELGDEVFRLGVGLFPPEGLGIHPWRRIVRGRKCETITLLNL